MYLQANVFWDGPHLLGVADVRHAWQTLFYIQILLRFRQIIVKHLLQILSVASCRLCEAELEPPAMSCPDLKVFPARRFSLACRYICRPQQRPKDVTPSPRTHSGLSATHQKAALLPVPDVK